MARELFFILRAGGGARARYLVSFRNAMLWNCDFFGPVGLRGLFPLRSGRELRGLEMPTSNPLSYATADMEVAEKMSWGYQLIYVFNLIGAALSVGFFGLTLLTCNDRFASGLGLIVG